MKAEEARELATKHVAPEDEKEIAHLHNLIGDQAKAGFFDIRVEYGVNKRVRNMLKLEGYSTSIGGNLDGTRSCTIISWEEF